MAARYVEAKYVFLNNQFDVSLFPTDVIKVAEDIRLIVGTHASTTKEAMST